MSIGKFASTNRKKYFLKMKQLQHGNSVMAVMGWIEEVRVWLVELMQKQA